MMLFQGKSNPRCPCCGIIKRGWVLKHCRFILQRVGGSYLGFILAVILCALLISTISTANLANAADWDDFTIENVKNCDQNAVPYFKAGCEFLASEPADDGAAIFIMKCPKDFKDKIKITSWSEKFISRSEINFHSSPVATYTYSGWCSGKCCYSPTVKYIGDDI